MRRALHVLLLLMVSSSIAVAGREAKAPAAAAKARPSWVKRAGKGIGFAAGFGLTAGLALSRRWNAPLTDEAGKPVTIEAKGRPFTLKKRHQSVVGPRIEARAQAMSTRTPLRRLVRTFVSGVGEGATRAPPAEGRFEANLAGAMRRLVE